MTSFVLLVPITQMDNSNHRTHWAVRARKQRQLRAQAKAACQGLNPLAGRLTLTVSFRFPDKRHRDLDNYSLKAAVDGAVDAGLIPDDRSTILHTFIRTRDETRAPRGYVRLHFTYTQDPT